MRTAERDGIEKTQIVLGRAFFSALMIAFILLVRDRKLFRIHLKDIWLFAGAAILSILMFSFCYYKTMELTSLSVAAVLLYTAPFFVIFLSAVFFREKLTLRKCLACLIAFAGCCLVAGIFQTETAISPAALGFGLLTGFGYGLYTIFSSALLKRGYHSLTILFYTFFFATLGCLAFVNPITATLSITKSGGALLNMFLLALFNSVLPYLLYTKGLSGTEPSVAPIIAMAEPVSATVVGAVFYGEAITVTGAIGMLLVLFAVGILNVGKRKRNAKN